MTALAEPRPTELDAPDAPAAAAPGGADGGAAPGALPRRISFWLHTSASLLWFGAFAFYVRVWLAPRDADGSIERSVLDVVDGTAGAPFQYRILAPLTIEQLHRAMGWPYGYAEMVVDLFALAIAVAVTAAILRRLRLELWVLPVALLGAYLQIGALWWGKTETYASLAATTVALWAILCDDRRRWVPLVLAAVVLAGTRTDLLLAVGVAAGARWAFAGRERRDLAAAVGLGLGAVAATVALKAAYPDATYDPQAGLLQIGHNLRPIPLLIALAFVLPPLAPYLLARREASVRTVVDRHRRWLVPVLALSVAEVAAIFVVGRADEVRLFLPIATPLALGAVVGWRALLAPYARREWATAAEG